MTAPGLLPQDPLLPSLWCPRWDLALQEPASCCTGPLGADDLGEAQTAPSPHVLLPLSLTLLCPLVSSCLCQHPCVCSGLPSSSPGARQSRCAFGLLLMKPPCLPRPRLLPPPAAALLFVCEAAAFRPCPARRQASGWARWAGPGCPGADADGKRDSESGAERKRPRACSHILQREGKNLGTAKQDGTAAFPFA